MTAQFVRINSSLREVLVHGSRRGFLKPRTCGLYRFSYEKCHQPGAVGPMKGFLSLVLPPLSRQPAEAAGCPLAVRCELRLESGGASMLAKAGFSVVLLAILACAKGQAGSVGPPGPTG